MRDKSEYLFKNDKIMHSVRTQIKEQMKTSTDE